MSNQTPNLIWEGKRLQDATLDLTRPSKLPLNEKGLYDKAPAHYPTFHIRNMRREDIAAAASIFYHAFNAFNASVGLPREWDSVEQAHFLVNALYEHPNYLAWVAEENGTGRVIGSNFLDVSDEVNAPGPMSIAPDAQNAKVGRAFMHFFKEYCLEIGKPEIRFVQVGNNAKSFALYSSLGYIPRDTLTMMKGRVSPEMAGRYSDRYLVRRMEPADVATCSKLYFNSVGVDRYHDINNSLAPGSPYDAWVLLDKTQAGRIVAYTTGYFLLGHGIYASEEAFQALFSLVSVQAAQESVFHLMAQRYPGVLLWAVRDAKIKVVRQQILMSHGKYRNPEGALYFPGMGY